MLAGGHIICLIFVLTSEIANCVFHLFLLTTSPCLYQEKLILQIKNEVMNLLICEADCIGIIGNISEPSEIYVLRGSWSHLLT